MPEFQSIGFWSESLINPARKNVPSYWTSDLDSEFLYYPQIKEQGNVTIFVYKIYNSNSAVQTYEIHLDGKTEYTEVDFGEKPAGWVNIGTFPFSGNGSEYVSIKKCAGIIKRGGEVKFVCGDGSEIMVCPDPEKILIAPTCPFAPEETFDAERLILPSIFADGMVIQRDQPLTVWGKAPKGQTVTVKFDGKTKETVSDSDFSVVFDPVTSGKTYTLEVSCGTENIRFCDILAGDVFLASGQSNMQWQLCSTVHYKEESKQADLPQIRFYRMDTYVDYQPRFDTINGKWTICTPENCGDFSAVAYYFAKTLYQKHGVPIGIIDSSWGGKKIELFVPNSEAERIESSANNENGYYSAYNAMIAPYKKLSVRGAIWYQGESDSHAGALKYQQYSEILLASWRNIWPNLPFLYVQLPKLSTHDFRYIREAQLEFYKSSKNTAMVSINEYGNVEDIHPTNKEPVGQRLAQCAEVLVYGGTGEYMGPIYEGYAPDGNKMEIRFSHSGEGLRAEGKITGFEVCGEDGKFLPANARITGKDRILVWNGTIQHPKHVRLGFALCPEINLTNETGIMASPFRTDSGGYDEE